MRRAETLTASMDKSSFLLKSKSTTKYRLILSVCMLPLGNEPRYMGKYQPLLIVWCGEQLERTSNFDPSEDRESIDATLIHSRSMKKGAMEEILGSVGVYLLESVP